MQGKGRRIGLEDRILATLAVLKQMVEARQGGRLNSTVCFKRPWKNS